MPHNLGLAAQGLLSLPSYLGNLRIRTDATRVPAPLALRAAAPGVLDQGIRDRATLVLDNQVESRRPARHILDNTPWLWMKLPVYCSVSESAVGVPAP